jgi:hypothetical protein
MPFKNAEETSFLFTFRLTAKKKKVRLLTARDQTLTKGVRVIL